MRAVIATILMITAGCAATPSVEAAEAPTGRRCDAAKAQALLGRQASSALGAEAMRLSGAGTLRWIAQGAMVTMDYSESRLNLQLDGQDKLVKITCG